MPHKMPRKSSLVEKVSGTLPKERTADQLKMYQQVAAYELRLNSEDSFFMAIEEVVHLLSNYEFNSSIEGLRYFLEKYSKKRS